MKKTSTYVASFIVSVFLVFALIASLGCLTAQSYASYEKIMSLVEEKQMVTLVRGELEKYFTDKSHSTDIPAEIYMDALTDEYLGEVIESRIRCGFAGLSRSHVYDEDMAYSPNSKLDSALDTFFSDYAAKTGYVKDEKYEKKLSNAKQNAYKIIDEYCDVYKFRALKQHGVLDKAAPVYTRLPLLTAGSCAAAAIVLLILLLVNRKEKGSLLYWLGSSAIAAGLIGALPCIFLIATDYFSAFTIKQAQIFTAYTTLMTNATKSFMFISIAAAGFGICMMVLYGIFFREEHETSEETK